MTTRSTAPPGTPSRVWIALHKFVTGRKRKWAVHSALPVFDQASPILANRIRQT